VVSLLLSVTFACGLVIAVAHVVNQRFVAPVYDVVANLMAFGCATAASVLLGHWAPALLSAVAMLCWLALARRTIRVRRVARLVPASLGLPHTTVGRGPTNGHRSRVHPTRDRRS
jgi:hypothetical protein